MIRANNFEVKIKPDSYAATNVADQAHAYVSTSLVVVIKEMTLDTLVFDIETQNFFTDPDVGWDNYDALKISVVAACIRI
jgi:hypothetical protein